MKEGSYSYDPSITTTYFNFSYDNADRVTQIFIYLGNIDFRVSLLDTFNVINFYYSGSFSLPIFAKVISHGGYSTSHSLKYDNSNRIVADSLYYSNPSGIPFSSYRNIYFYYYSNYILRKELTSTGFSTDTIFISDGNINFFKASNYTGASYKYDNKINPFYYLNVSTAFLAIGSTNDPNRASFSDWSLYNKNNVINSSYYANTSSIPYNSYFNMFTYNSSNMPVRRILRDNNGFVIDTLEYKYY